MTHSAVGMWKWLFPEWQKLRRSLSPEIWVCWELINETAAYNAWKYEVFHSTITSTNVYQASAMCWVTLSNFCTNPAILPHFLTVTEMKSFSVPPKANTFPLSSGSRPFLLHQRPPFSECFPIRSFPSASKLAPASPTFWLSSFHLHPAHS